MTSAEVPASGALPVFHEVRVGRMTGPHVVLVGLMGVGKSSVGRGVAARFRWACRDSDEDVERVTGRTGRAIAADAREGVDGLHALEEAVLLGALAWDEPTVISAAGWVAESDRCRVAMRRRAMVVWLDAPVEVLRERMKSNNERRPMDPAELSAVAARRLPLFESVADLRVDATRPVDVIVADVIAAVRPA
jgi:shikimate kinase